MTISANTLFSGGRLLSAVQLLPLVVERAGKEADKREQRAGNNNETPGQVGSEELLRHEGPGLGARVGPL